MSERAVFEKTRRLDGRVQHRVPGVDMEDGLARRFRRDERVGILSVLYC